MDVALINDFDMVLFWHGVPRKNNKRPTVNSRGNVYGEYVNGKKELKINMTGNSVQFGDRKLGRYGKSERNIDVISEFLPNNQMSNSVSVEFGKNKKVVRALYKIGLSTLAYYLGPNEVLKDKYDVIRKYVLSGIGKRSVILLGEESQKQEFRNQAWPPFGNNGEYAVTFRLAYMDFTTDLSKEITIYPKLIEELKKQRGTQGWTYLPIE